MSVKDSGWPGGKRERWTQTVTLDVGRKPSCELHARQEILNFEQTPELGTGNHVGKRNDVILSLACHAEVTMLT